MRPWTRHELERLIAYNRTAQRRLQRAGRHQDAEARWVTLNRLLERYLELLAAENASGPPPRGAAGQRKRRA